MEKYKIIEESILAQLIRNSIKLYALEAAGVDNWIGYGYRIEAYNELLGDGDLSYDEELKQSDSEITRNYFTLGEVDPLLELEQMQNHEAGKLLKKHFDEAITKQFNLQIRQ